MPKIPLIEFEKVYAKDRATFRAWLEHHHTTSPGIWLVYYKKNSGQPSISYPEAVKEALCFGWIDSKVNSLDDKRYMQVFTPRKPKSVWSALNKKYIAELQEQKRMTAAGLKCIAIAKQNGMWESLDKIEALEIPDDLANLFSKNKKAKENFATFPPSSKKNILQWIASAKRGETRQKRLEETVTLAAQGLKANHYRQ
ncbi:MAG: YdeI/OmpD-associated family protein [Trueperaceae bacterium]